MQKNGVNGGHQHEVSEKRLAPGALPRRLDMELCACVAKRWVDLQGRPATPWQFINLETRQKEQEGTKAAPRTPPKSVLDGLITCGSCDQPMFLDDTQGNQEASYTGSGRAPARAGVPRRGCTPTGQKVLLIGKVLQTVLTHENISRALAVENDPQRYDEAREHRLTRQDLQKVREIPERFVLAWGGAPRTRDFLN